MPQNPSRRLVLPILAGGLLLAGCANPYLSPDISAAIHDREVMRELKVQTEIMRQQTEEMQKQTALLERIAGGTR